MIKEFIERFDNNREKLQVIFRNKHPEDYKEIVKILIEHITDDENSDFSPDPERIHQIDDGDYQGTLVFVIGQKGYQPSVYYIVLVSYGSCSGCDTLESIRNYDEGIPNEQQAKDYFTLALHIVQKLIKIEYQYE